MEQSKGEFDYIVNSMGLLPADIFILYNNMAFIARRQDKLILAIRIDLLAQHKKHQACLSGTTLNPQKGYG